MRRSAPYTEVRKRDTLQQLSLHLSDTSGGAREEGSRTRTGTRQKYVLCEEGRVELPQWVVALSLLLFWTFTAVVAASLGSQQCIDITEKCDPCPEGWVWYAEKCYYFSDIQGYWNSSQEYCSRYNGTLAILKSKQEMIMIEHFKDHKYWVGIIKRPDGWWWLDGSLFSRFPFLNNDSSLGCQYLNRGYFYEFNCMTAQHWMCTRTPSSCFMFGQ
ncbi:C-type lectin domain family 2 member B-like [Microcaecilia unicolor]|uniref:C-type lectin domain family 2 member B-like n=1 Tax=Microcaecilia unicolor TaxID=1415580 RepID=A0A6P7WY64_9AMPH|nr:C-type lectin domain family 2 member B-like [Microcaecilia unicolor]